MTGRHEFGSDQLSATVSADGAELCLLRNAAGLDYLWPATPPWPRHAPVLFPIVGRLQDDTLTHDGRSYRMTQHGFARDRQFTWVDRSPSGCILALTDDAQTRAIYPFGFRFEVAYAVRGATLEITYTIVNTAGTVLPASMGAHPAFRWPLTPGAAKDSYSLTFDADEPGEMPGLEGGLVTRSLHPSPIQGRHLALTPALFEHDALILLHPVSRSVRFAAGDGPALTVSWEGFPQLGIWSRPDADFLCIEPWCGVASPAGFSGEFSQKPYLALIPPGERRAATHRITIE